jgi:hypothetical protein
MDYLHVIDRVLGHEDGLRRRAFARLRWIASTPPRDYFDADKRRLFATVRPFTMVSYARLSNTYALCLEAERARIPGAFVECGVWKGGTSGVMASVASRSDRLTWLFDSFEGLPEPSALDGVGAQRFTGRCVGPQAEAERLLFDLLHLDRARIVIRKGWFQDTLPLVRAEIGPIAVLRLDGDWYDSTRVCFENLYDAVAPGGFVILDDYGFWEGCRRATDEFLAARDLRVELHRVDYSGAWFRKPSPLT